MSGNDKKVELYHRINKLKIKAGLSARSQAQGVISPAKVKKAQEAIDAKEQEYPIEVENLLEKLENSWQQYKAASDASRSQFLNQVYNYSNNVKDLSGMYHHDLMHHFSLSLTDFCEKIDVKKEQHQIIVQAHIDMMRVTYEEKLRQSDSEKAEELKLVVAKAIEKYS
jgi:hypothetical protein